jgi:hypothetical protein
MEEGVVDPLGPLEVGVGAQEASFLCTAEQPPARVPHLGVQAGHLRVYR